MCATPQGKTSARARARARTRTARTSVQARGVCGSASVSVLGRGMGEEKGGGLCHESVRLQEARVARVKLEEGGGVLVAFPFLADPLNGENGSVPIENLAGERANVPGCQAPTRPDSGPEHSALSNRRDGQEDSVVSRLWAEKRWRINWGPRKSMASLFLSFFFWSRLAWRRGTRNGRAVIGEGKPTSAATECENASFGGVELAGPGLPCPVGFHRPGPELPRRLLFFCSFWWRGGAHGAETSVDSVEIRRVTSLPPLSAVERIRAGEWRCMNGTADTISAGGPRPPAPTSARVHQLAIIILLEN